VEFDKIVGNVNDEGSTTTGFKVVDADMGEYWEHGYPHGFEIPIIGDRGIVYNNGDGTVPLESAKSENIFADEVIELDSSHRELPTNAQKEIIKILTGVEPDDVVESNLIRDLLFVSVYSPIDIQVVAPDGKKVGKDFATGEIINEIDGAYYSGSGTENEFLTIPNPDDGEYKILTQGTGDGEYKIEAAKITEDPDTGIASESTVEIIGTATLGQEEEKKINVAGSEITTENQDTIAPEISIASPEENKNYLNNQIITITYQITDNQSPAEKIQSQATWDGVNLIGNKIDLAFQHLG